MLPKDLKRKKVVGPDSLFERTRWEVREWLRERSYFPFDVECEENKTRVTFRNRRRGLAIKRIPKITKLQRAEIDEFIHRLQAELARDMKNGHAVKFQTITESPIELSFGLMIQ